MEQEWTTNANSKISFHNTGFGENVIYDTISTVTGSTISANLKQAKQEGLLELHIPDAKGNRLASELPLDNRNTTYESNIEADMTLASRVGEDVPEQYAALQGKRMSYEASFYHILIITTCYKQSVIDIQSDALADNQNFS